jgi:hypothetical protein
MKGIKNELSEGRSLCRRGLRGKWNVPLPEGVEGEMECPPGMSPTDLIKIEYIF